MWINAMHHPKGRIFNGSNEDHGKAEKDQEFEYNSSSSNPSVTTMILSPSCIGDINSHRLFLFVLFFSISFFFFWHLKICPID